MEQMYKVFINGNPLVITNRASLFEQKKAVKKLVFTKKSSLENAIKTHLTDKDQLLWIYAYDIEQCWMIFQDLFKNISAGGGLVRNEKGELLFIYRRKKWDLPKGKTEKGESISETAIREVEEECGINVALSDSEIFKTTYHVYFEKGKPILKTSHWFLMDLLPESTEPIPQEEEEIEKVSWFHPENLSIVYRNSFFNIIDLCQHYCEQMEIKTIG
ncbi:NUDIX hydrolase [Luteibaculum oceani]|uniref:NUDIX domain-containing protein n=1 Tax=Luteibaculum oceani TaxID=1294296 RepID=A0A5C6VAA3_9FLAO|nr:NUDIX domain-containing protein [Luteibaculum oceani]TXC81750.1 NUDIX domain-containing protein [Luteibaculum oceani]